MPLKSSIYMEFEEKIEIIDGVALNREETNLGTFYKKLIAKKYRNVIGLKQELTDNVVFCESLKANAAMAEQFRNPNQLYFKVNEDDGGVYEIELEQGNYQTFHQLLTINPAVVAAKDYIDNVVKLVASMLKQLHERNVYQCCLAPQWLFARKSDNMPMLLLQGSFFTSMSNQRELYEGFEEYMAPEVFLGDAPDERSDVYALGKLIQRLYADGSLPFEYKTVVATAIDADPEKRYPNINLMLEDINKKRSMFRSTVAFAAAIGIGLLCLFVYMDMMPEPVDVEFVKPVEEEVSGDPYDNPVTAAELGLDPNDSIFVAATKQAQYSDNQAEIERVFRHQFTREAENTLSKIYSKENMNASEQTFINSNRTMMEDLLHKRDELASKAGMDAEQAYKIANEIISNIQMREKEKLKSYGFQDKPSE